MFPNWLKWTISLALLLTVGVLGIWWAGEIRTKTGSLTAPDFGWLEFWLNRYQTLIGGFVALGGAFLAFQAVRGQIAQLDRLEEQRRGRESYAARTASGPQLHLRLRRELYGSFGLGWVWDGSAEGLGTAANSP